DPFRVRRDLFERIHEEVLVEVQDQVHRRPEEGQGRDQDEDQEDEDELRPESRSENLVAPLDQKLDEVAQQEEEQRHHEEAHGDDEDAEDDPVGLEVELELAGVTKDVVDRAGGEQHEADGGDDEAGGALSYVHLSGTPRSPSRATRTARRRGGTSCGTWS